MPHLPPPHGLVWAHATNSVSKLSAALADPIITAIEADVMLGYTTGTEEKRQQPITSHPPHLLSDLSVSSFMHELKRSKTLRHAKLDFKQMEAVPPVLQLLKEVCPLSHHEDAVAFLNADILPGPGRRGQPVPVPADRFIESCLDQVEGMRGGDGIRFAFSLGYRVRYESGESYSADDALSMSEVVSKHNLLSRSAGVVLALNARLLALKPDVFDSFLAAFPGTQILAWTGAGEPPIPQQEIESIKHHFFNMETRIGFDCDIEKQDSSIKI